MTLTIRAFEWQLSKLKKRKEDLQIKFARSGHKFPKIEKDLISKFDKQIAETENLLAKERMKQP